MTGIPPGSAEAAADRAAGRFGAFTIDELDMMRWRFRNPAGATVRGLYLEVKDELRVRGIDPPEAAPARQDAQAPAQEVGDLDGHPAFVWQRAVEECLAVINEMKPTTALNKAARRIRDLIAPTKASTPPAVPAAPAPSGVALNPHREFWLRASHQDKRVVDCDVCFLLSRLDEARDADRETKP